jgi:hypothetical protein
MAIDAGPAANVGNRSAIAAEKAQIAGDIVRLHMASRFLGSTLMALVAREEQVAQNSPWEFVEITLIRP